MVSCIESLTSNIETKDNLESKINTILIKEDFTIEEKQEIVNWTINRKIKQKFIKFIEAHSADGFFKTGYRKAKHCYVKKIGAKNYLSRIYDARSAYIHEGIPMYISFDMNVGDDSSDGKCHLWDLDPASDTMTDRKIIKGSKKLPRVRWFEIITNFSLKNFIKEKMQ